MVGHALALCFSAITVPDVRNTSDVGRWDAKIYFNAVPTGTTTEVSLGEEAEPTENTPAGLDST